MKNSTIMAVTAVALSLTSLFSKVFPLACAGLFIACVAVICLTIEDTTK